MLGPSSWNARRRCVLTLLLGMAVGCRATGADLPVDPEDDAEAFTVVALPDTQYYSALHPEIMDAQVQWILANLDGRRIALVVHEGDIVDADEARQWERASRSLHALDGRVPYVLSAGNHDYSRTATAITRKTLIDEYFPPRGFTGNGWFRETFEPDRIENSFAIVDTSAGPWLVMALEFGPRDAVLAWADRIAKQFPSTPAMVVTHGYLDSDDRRYEHPLSAKQPWHPYRYLGDGAPGGTNDGEEIWQKLVGPNRNVAFVLCGHDLGDGVGRLTSVRADGSKVHQLLANYQTEPQGGLGYLRLMRFLPAQHRVVVQTYSPVLDRFKTDPANDFQLDYDVPSTNLAASSAKRAPHGV